MSKKVLLYGGAFDPPHTGHAATAKLALTFMAEHFEFEELWFLPSFSDAFGKKKMVDADHRINMLDLLLYEIGEPRFKICTDEIDMANNAGTYAVIKSLLRKHPDKEFVYVIGTDQAKVIKSWRNSRKLRMTLQFLIVKRKGIRLPYGKSWCGTNNFLNGTKRHHIFLDKCSTARNITSTEIRRDLADYNNIFKTKPHPWLYGNVQKYIMDNGLYKAIPKEPKNSNNWLTSKEDSLNPW